MNRPCHMIVGAGAGVLVAHLAGVDPLLPAVVGALAGPLPDIDLHWAPRWHRPMAGAPCGLLEHRGPTHSLMAVLAVAIALVWWLPPTWTVMGYALAAGYASHLAADMISPLGEPFLWPVSARRYRLLPYGLRVPVGTPLIEVPVAVGLAILLAIVGS